MLNACSKLCFAKYYPIYYIFSMDAKNFLYKVLLNTLLYIREPYHFASHCPDVNHRALIRGLQKFLHWQPHDFPGDFSGDTWRDIDAETEIPYCHRNSGRVRCKFGDVIRRARIPRSGPVCPSVPARSTRVSRNNLIREICAGAEIPTDGKDDRFPQCKRIGASMRA